MVVWLTFWGSAMLVAFWQLGAEMLASEPGALIFLAVWVLAAGFWKGSLRLK